MCIDLALVSLDVQYNIVLLKPMTKRAHSETHATIHWKTWLNLLNTHRFVSIRCVCVLEWNCCGYTHSRTRQVNHVFLQKQKLLTRLFLSLYLYLVDLRIAFDLLDRNQDGKITSNELQFMLKNLGINVRDELIDDLIKEASHSGK